MGPEDVGEKVVGVRKIWLNSGGRAILGEEVVGRRS